MTSRSFPILYVARTERSLAFYEALGFHAVYRFPPDGEADYLALERGGDRLGITRAEALGTPAGVARGTEPAGELFVYVDDLAAALDRVGRVDGVTERPPQAMPWGETIAHVRDPDGHRVVLALAGG